MGIRLFFQQHPIALIGLLVLVIAGALIRAFAGARSTEVNVGVPNAAWYTTDDGKTWFADDSKLLPPFDHGGKPAYRAYVFTCDGGKTRFVAFMSRYTPEAQRKMEEQRRSKEPPELGVIDRIMTSGTEVKRPGEDKWVRASNPLAADVRKPKCPDGSDKVPQPVLP
jgi:hypothetical protein